PAGGEERSRGCRSTSSRLPTGKWCCATTPASSSFTSSRRRSRSWSDRFRIARFGCRVVRMTAPAAPPATFTIALVQMRMAADPGANIESAVRRIRDAAIRGAKLVCLPELFRTRYIGQREDHALFDLAESVPGPTTEVLSKVARETGVVIVASLFERRAPGLYHNTAVVIDADGRLAGRYR